MLLMTVSLRKKKKMGQNVYRIITIKNNFNIIENLTGYIKKENSKDSLIQFDIGESCYIPNECFKILNKDEQIKQKNDIIKIQKGKEMQKIVLLDNELEVTNQIMLECDLVGVINKDRSGIEIIKNRMNNVTGLVPSSMWNSLVEDYQALEEKANKKAQEEVQKMSDEAEEEALDEIMEVFNDFLNQMNQMAQKPEVQKATSKINEVFEGAAKSLDEIRPNELVKEIQESFGKRGNLKSFLESIEKTVNEVYGTAQEKAQEVKETVKTKVDNVARALNSYERAQLEIRRDKLIAFQQEAGELGVQTKGFNKKIQKKIDSINKILG